MPVFIGRLPDSGAVRSVRRRVHWVRLPPDAVGVWSEVLRRDPSQRDALMYLRMVRGAEGASDETRDETSPSPRSEG